MTLNLGSLCSGYEGLGMGIAEVLDVELAWVADNEPAAASLLAHHWPDVPNLGDITKTDWSQVKPADIVCAGFPCQDISYAGLGAGIQEGNRSGLWHVIADALGVLRPQVVVLENVGAIVARRPGLDVVLADLAELGFDAEWCCVRAADVGAPHRRERWFLVAQDADRAASGERWLPAPGQTPGGRSWADAGRRSRTPAADSGDHGREGCQERDLGTEAQLTSQQRDDSHGLVGAVADTSGGRGDWVHERVEPGHVAAGPREDGAGIRASAAPGETQWGAFEPAIRRWERVTGHPAPDPTEPGQGGKPRLNPVFVEWMQGLAAGHVTAVPGLTRNQQLKLLGNGVVPAQAAHALRLLLPALFAAMERTDVPA